MSKLATSSGRRGSKKVSITMLRCPRRRLVDFSKVAGHEAEETMLTRFILIVLLFMSSILAAAVGPESFTTSAGPTAVEWVPAAGPVDPGTLVNDTRTPEGLTVHEWGTFTSVAGPFGKAID